MIKTQQIFDNYSLGDLCNVLKAHQSEINEIAEETKMSLGGPLELMSKVTTREAEVEYAENDGSEDEGLIVNSGGEAMAFYLKNKVKKFFKESFNS